MLKGKLHRTTITHHDYSKQLTDALESSHYVREAEVKKLNMMLNKVKNEKDEEIRRLREEMMSLQDSCSIDAVYNFK